MESSSWDVGRCVRSRNYTISWLASTGSMLVYSPWPHAASSASAVDRAPVLVTSRCRRYPHGRSHLARSLARLASPPSHHHRRGQRRGRMRIIVRLRRGIRRAGLIESGCVPSRRGQWPVGMSHGSCLADCIRIAFCSEPLCRVPVLKMARGPLTQYLMCIYSIRVSIWSKTRTHGYVNGAKPSPIGYVGTRTM
jgi:hypothetical protein